MNCKWMRVNIGNTFSNNIYPFLSEVRNMTESPESPKSRGWLLYKNIPTVNLTAEGN